MLKKIEEHPWLSSILLLITIIFIFSGACFFMDLNSHINYEAYVLYSVMALTISLILLYLAHHRTEQALKQSKQNYLLKIDERWSSEPIIRARRIIHGLYLQAKKQVADKDNNELVKNEVSRMIMDLHSNSKKINDFIDLLNFIDFLETVGHLFSNGSISEDDANELLGDSIVYFHDIFKVYIKYRRDKKNKNFYKKFEFMRDKINKKNMTN